MSFGTAAGATMSFGTAAGATMSTPTTSNPASRKTQAATSIEVPNESRGTYLQTSYLEDVGMRFLSSVPAHEMHVLVQNRPCSIDQHSHFSFKWDHLMSSKKPTKGKSTGFKAERTCAVRGWYQCHSCNTFKPSHEYKDDLKWTNPNRYLCRECRRQTRTYSTTAHDDTAIAKA